MCPLVKSKAGSPKNLEDSSFITTTFVLENGGTLKWNDRCTTIGHTFSHLRDDTTGHLNIVCLIYLSSGYVNRSVPGDLVGQIKVSPGMKEQH